MIRHRLLQGCCLLLTGLVAAPTARAQAPFAQNVVPSRTALDRLGLERAWYAMVPLSGGRERVIGISQAEDLIFAQTNVGTFFAFDGETGRLRWSANLGVASPEAYPAAVNSDEVFVTTGFRLHALDRRTGRPLWKVELPGRATSAAGASEERAVVGLEQGKLIAYYAREIVNKKTSLQQFKKHGGDFAWAWQTNAKITARPIVTGQVIAFASQDGKVYVAVNEPSKILLRWPSAGPIVGSMGTYHTRTLMVSSRDGSLYAIDLFTGDLHWTFPSGAPIEQEPLVGDDDVYVVNVLGTMNAVDAKTGQSRWTLTSGASRFLAVGARRVYARSLDGDLIIIDRSNGSPLFDARASSQRAGLNLRDYTLGITNYFNDRIYMATPSGLLLGLREAGQLRPLPIRKPGSEPFGYIPPSTPESSDTPPAATAPVPPPAAAPADADAKGDDEPKEKPEPRAKPKPKGKGKAKAKVADDEATDEPTDDAEMPKPKKK